MVFRVTNQGQQQSALNNVFRISEDLFKVQNELSSGQRIQKPSDDPSGTRQTLSLRTDLDQTKQFIRNIKNMQRFTNGVDSALDDISVSLIRTRELTVNQLNATSTAETRKFAAAEMENLIAQIISSANFKVGNRYLFGGGVVDSAPFSQSASGAVYGGNTESITSDISEDVSFQVNIPGSEILATDLNPTLSQSTVLSDLNGGSGVSAGAFSITDRSGNTGTVSITSDATLGTVISEINALETNVSASINSQQNGISLTDDSTLITGALTILEDEEGTTAKELGILGSRNGDFTGLDLDPVLSDSTVLSQLNAGSGILLSDIQVINGAASGTISFSSLNSNSTVGDLRKIINNSGLNVVIDVGSGGNDLKVVSTDSSTVAVVEDIGTGTTAEVLGLGGGRNIITTLVKLKTALEINDRIGLLSSLKNINSGLDTMGEARAKIGAIGRRLQSNQGVHDQGLVNQSQRLAGIEEVDFAKKASELAALELAFQATLNSTARILQPSLLNFLS